MSSHRSLTLLKHGKGVLQKKPDRLPPHATRCDDRGSDSKVFWHIPFGDQKDVINATMVTGVNLCVNIAGVRCHHKDGSDIQTHRGHHRGQWIPHHSYALGVTIATRWDRYGTLTTTTITTLITTSQGYILSCRYVCSETLMS